MKKEERDYLYNEKISSGMSERQAWKEVNQLEYSQKVIFKEKKKEINKLKSDYEKLEKKYERLLNKQGKSKDFKKQFLFDTRSETKIKEIKNEDVEKLDKNTKLATTKDLTRMLSLLRAEGTLGLSDLTKTCCLNPKVSKNALSFLSKFDIVELIEKGGTTEIKLK